MARVPQAGNLARLRQGSPSATVHRLAASRVRTHKLAVTMPIDYELLSYGHRLHKAIWRSYAIEAAACIGGALLVASALRCSLNSHHGSAISVLSEPSSPSRLSTLPGRPARAPAARSKTSTVHEQDQQWPRCCWQSMAVPHSGKKQPRTSTFTTTEFPAIGSDDRRVRPPSCPIPPVRPLGR